MNAIFDSLQYMEISSDVTNITRVEHLIDGICDKYNINDDNYGNMLIALTEAVNNAIVHGNSQESAKKVKVSLNADDAGVVFSIKDEGSGFDFKSVPDPTLPENLDKLSGRGVFLMKSLADNVEFEDAGSKVVLTFKLSLAS